MVKVGEWDEGVWFGGVTEKVGGEWRELIQPSKNANGMYRTLTNYVKTVE